MVVSANLRDGGGSEGEYDQSCANKPRAQYMRGNLLYSPVYRVSFERSFNDTERLLGSRLASFLSRLNCCKARSGHNFTAPAHKRASAGPSDRPFLIRTNLRRT